MSMVDRVCPRTAGSGQLARFAVVGATSFAVTFGSFWALERAGVHHAAAAGIAWLVGVAVNYPLNRAWTFGAADGPQRRQLPRFFALAVLAAGANAALVAWFVDPVGLTEFLAEVAAVALIAPITFTASREWIFAR